MIKRIKKITNIGTFSNFTAGGSFEFNKLTFIYGLNTKGKTTLTDILQSIQKDDFSILETRKSIPVSSLGQNVELNYKGTTDATEQVLKINSGSWENNQIGENIEIFSSEFIHRNLFTGLSIERANKENFTKFILGDTGVVLANLIKEKRINLNRLKRELPNKKPLYVKDVVGQDLENFLNIDISELNLEDLKAEHSNKLLENNKLKEQIKEPEKVLSKPTPTLIEAPQFDVLVAVENINKIFNCNYEEISEEALNKVTEHIASNFKDKEIAENWIKTGVNNIEDESCSFCGQELSNVKDLIGAYNQFFNKAYNDFITDIETRFDENKRAIINNNFSLREKYNNELIKIRQFEELINDDEFKEKINEYDVVLNSLNEDELNSIKSNTLEEVDKLYAEKILKPHSSTDLYEKTKLEESISGYVKISDSLNEKGKELIELIVKFKEKFQNIEVLKGEYTIKEKELKKIEYKIKRIEQNETCETYKSATTEIATLQNVIVTKETELETNQTSYLQTYYHKINTLFEQFGSRNFTLEKSSSTRGNQPVYSLKVKFHGQEINERDFAKVFSESDKRALALAVFWTKIEMMSAEERLKTIVVLDDPVTSFDDNRVTKSITLFKGSIDDLDQVIVLTHYPNFIKRFFEVSHNDSANIKFLELKKDSQTSKLLDCDIDKIIKSDYQLTYDKIIGYINSEHEDCIKGDLRKFLETSYIPHFFPHKIKQGLSDGQDMSTLGRRIDYIFSSQDEVKSKFHSFRENTNPDSHIYTSSNIEDVKSFASEMMNYLYSETF